MKTERFALLSLLVAILVLAPAAASASEPDGASNVAAVLAAEPSAACHEAAAALHGAEAQWTAWMTGPRPEARYAEQSLYLDYSLEEIETIAARFLAVAAFSCPELALDAQYQGGLALDRFADELAAMALPDDLGADPEVRGLLANERRLFEVRVRVTAAERWLEGLAYALEHGLHGEEIAIMERRIEEIWDQWEGLQASLTPVEPVAMPR